MLESTDRSSAATSTMSAAPSLRRLGGIGMVVLWAALLARTLGLADAGMWPWYIVGFVAFLAIELAVTLRSFAVPLVHVAMGVQAATVLVLLGIDPQLDFISVLLVLQCYEAAVTFPALPRTIWVAFLVVLMACSLVFELGLVRGLALGLVPMAAGVVLAMFVVVLRELDDARAASERIVADLRAAQRRLRAHAEQADELAAIEQRSRVAGELELSVSRTLADALAAGTAAREALDEPEKAAPRLERLQELTQRALAQMRGVIAELRPPQS